MVYSKFIRLILFLLVSGYFQFSPAIQISVNTGNDGNFWILDSTDIRSQTFVCTLKVSDIPMNGSGCKAELSARDAYGKEIATIIPSNIDSIEYSSYNGKITIKPGRIGPCYVIVTIKNSADSIIKSVIINTGVIVKRSFSRSSRFGISGYGSIKYNCKIPRDSAMVRGLLRLIGAKSLRANLDFYDSGDDCFFNYRCIDQPSRCNRVDANGNCVEWVAEYFAPNLSTASWMRGMDETQGENGWSKQPPIHCFGAASNEIDSKHPGENDVEYLNKEATKLSNNVTFLQELVNFKTTRYPNNQLALPAITYLGISYLQELVNNTPQNIINEYSIIDFHEPNNPVSPDVSWGDDSIHFFLGSLKKIYRFNQQFVPRKKIWLGEFYGCTFPFYNGNNNSSNENTMACNFALKCALAIAMGVEKLFFWNLFDFNQNTDINYDENYYGLFKMDATPKATVWAFQTAAYYLDSATFVGEINLSDPNQHGLLFTTKIGNVAVLWHRAAFSFNGAFLAGPNCNASVSCYTNNPKDIFSTFGDVLNNQPPWYSYYDNSPWRTSEIKIALNKDNFQISDCFGDTIKPNLDGWDRATVKLTGAPIYIVGGKFTIYNSDPNKLLTNTVPRRKYTFFDLEKCVQMNLKPATNMITSQP